ncbi:hypothetical protein LR090_06115 [Candidatus Bipolaricaulota bacterium]|nr:hypothetical protein [Candidatus Bipolaricaulota bacterium]
MRKVLVIGIGGVLVLILGLLSGGLARLEFAPGKALPYRPLTLEEGQPGGPVFLPETWAEVIFRVMQVTFLGSLGLALLGLVLSRRFRKRVLKLMPVALALLLLMLFLPWPRPWPGGWCSVVAPAGGPRTPGGDPPCLPGGGLRPAGRGSGG